MALKKLQVTIAAAGSQPTRAIATHTPVCHAVIEADDGNSNPAFIGPTGVTSATGIRLHNSATVPGRMELGPFSAVGPFNLDELYVAGTEGEKVNILYVTL